MILQLWKGPPRVRPPAKTKKVNLSKLFTSIASILFLSFLKWSLSSLMTWENWEIASLVCLLSKFLNTLHASWVVFPLVHRRHGSLGVDRQLPVILASGTCSSGSRLRFVFQCELIQIHALFFRPPQLPSVNICLEMITWFLGLSMFRTARCFHLHDVTVNWQYIKLFFRHSFLLFWRSGHCPQMQHKTPSGQHLAHDRALRLRRDFT